MPIRSWFLAALTLLGTAPLAAVTPHLVKDLNPYASEGSSSPERFVPALGLAFFTASDGESGTELWRSDGTAQGTFQVVDACPGECSSQVQFLAFNDRSYFFVASDGSGGDLWVTDGTRAKTVRLGTFQGFSSTGRGKAWIASQKLLYFAANDGVHGLGLWRTDGTPAGTVLVSNGKPGIYGFNPDQLTDFNGRLFFSAFDDRGTNLWTSDGTPQGTRLVRDILSDDSYSPEGPVQLRVLGQNLFFTALSQGRGYQLWRSDGTTRGTLPLTTFAAQFLVYEPLSNLTPSGNRLFFLVDDKVQGQDLWVSDGTVKGTRPVTSFKPARAFSFGELDIPYLPFQVFKNRLFFAANDGAHGMEFWSTDGTSKGTRLLRDVCPGPCSGVEYSIPAVSGNLLYFGGVDGVHGLEPWVTDGTAAGTRIVRDLCTQNCSSDGFLFRTAAGQVYFVARDGRNGRQVWRSDGSAAGTRPVTRFLNSTFLSFGFHAVVLGRNLLFSGRDERGQELWKSDGTVQGTSLLADINPLDLGGSYPSVLFEAGGEAWFYAWDGLENGLFRSNGTEGGTSRFSAIERVESDPPQPQDISSTVAMGGNVFIVSQLGETNAGLWRLQGSSSSTAVRLTPEDLRVYGPAPKVVGGTLYFTGTDEDHGRELWKTDGTVSGTRRVADLEPGFSGSEPEMLTAFQNRLYFTADVGLFRRELWRTDGTEAGTVLIKDIRPDGSSDVDLLTEHAGRLWFFATDEEHGRELWSTDGTPEGTRLHELMPGSEGFQAGGMLWNGDRLFLSGDGLWTSDTTAAGTHRISGVVLAQSPFYPSKPLVDGGTVYFSGRVLGASVETLWKSDGTAEGTLEVPDHDGLPVPGPISFQAFAGRVYFTTQYGGELFETDGTPSGTFPILELRSPQEHGSLGLLRAGPRLFFSKWNRATGTELWALEEN